MEILSTPTQEEWFDIWCQELIDAGYIDEVITHPNVPTFQLFKGLSKPYDKKKNVIMNPVAYTMDRILRWNAKAMGIFCTPFDGEPRDWDSCYFKPQYHGSEDYYYTLAEVKGPTGNQKAYGSDFKFTQKWLWANTKQFVQKVMLAPVKPLKNNLPYLWATTFTPERFLYTDKLSTNKNKPIPYRAIPNKKGVPNWEVRSLKEFLEMKNPTIK